MTNFKLDFKSGELQLQCQELDGKPAHLYSVIVTTPTMGTQTHYVLAEGPIDAEGMARCAMGCAHYEIPYEIDKQITTHVTRLPLTVSGWGKNKV